MDSKIINIDTVIADHPLPTSAIMIRGGIRVEINGHLLTQYLNSENIDWVYNWQPEYVGEHIRSDLSRLMWSLLELTTTNEHSCDHMNSDLLESHGYFQLSIESDDKLRVAFHASTSSNEDYDDVVPPECSRLGLVVPLNLFCIEVASQSHNLVQFAEHAGIDDERAVVDFIQLLDDFEDNFGIKNTE